MFKHAWFDDKNPNSGYMAELTALEAGLKEAVQYADLKTHLIIYCDNMVVLNIVNANFIEKTKRKYVDAIERLAVYTRQFGSVETRHVKAHTDTRGHQGHAPKKYHMNRWCDINARRQRKYLGQKPIRNDLYGFKGMREAEQTSISEV